MDPSYSLTPSRFVFVLHTLWWGAFLVARVRLLARAEDATAGAPRHESAPVHAPHAMSLVWAHSVVITALYPALWMATTRLDAPGTARGVAATGLLALGGAAAAWAMAVFRSYRLRATLEPGHELCEAGPFQFVRHPIYLAFGLLGVGSAVWAPTVGTCSVAVLLWVIGDLRARGEERLLEDTFGEHYRRYRSRTARLVPWVY